MPGRSKVVELNVCKKHSMKKIKQIGDMSIRWGMSGLCWCRLRGRTDSREVVKGWSVVMLEIDGQLPINNKSMELTP